MTPRVLATRARVRAAFRLASSPASRLPRTAAALREAARLAAILAWLGSTERALRGAP